MGATPGLVGKDEFLKLLAETFAATRDRGSIWMTHKRLTYDGGDTAMAGPSHEEDDREYLCIIKVTDGRDFKMSAHISASELAAFHAAYGALLKSSMSTLKKRDKKKEKARFEKAQLRRKILATDVEIIGPKRGAGRRKLRRRVAAAAKQKEAREKQAERDELRAKKIQSSALL